MGNSKQIWGVVTRRVHELAAPIVPDTGKSKGLHGKDAVNAGSEQFYGLELRNNED